MRLFLALALWGAGCATDVTAAEAKRLVKSGATVLDVRSKEEFRERHIPGAVNIPVEELKKRMSELPREKPLVVHCHTGARSGAAVIMLKRAGFSEVHNLGSMGRWYVELPETPPLY